MRNFRELNVWKKSHEMTIDIYSVTENFPKQELYGLTSQIRRASVSVASNIVEGCGRGSDADFCRFLQISLGSAYELEYQLLLAKDLKFLTEEIYEKMNKDILAVIKMLTSLLKTVQNN